MAVYGIIFCWYHEDIDFGEHVSFFNLCLSLFLEGLLHQKNLFLSFEVTIVMSAL